LDWVGGIETPYPAQPSAGFPAQVDVEGETWAQLCRRFLDGCQKAAAITHMPDPVHLLVFAIVAFVAVMLAAVIGFGGGPIANAGARFPSLRSRSLSEKAAEYGLQRCDSGS
jgi:hypothetical protein